MPRRPPTRVRRLRRRRPPRRYRPRRRRELIAELRWTLGLGAVGILIVGLTSGAILGQSPVGAEHGQARAAADRQPGGDGAREAGAPDAGPIDWRSSVAAGTHNDGRLVRGVMLPAEGRRWVTWDPIERRSPNRRWRRWGTDRLIRTTLQVLREYAERHPRAPRVMIGDLSRPEGGSFGPEFGGIGHSSHQNGLDIDVYYPRRDGRERPPDGPGDADIRLAGTLIELFTEAGAEVIYVAPSLPELSVDREIVEPLVHHDTHLHARLPLD